jgi:hypothetical protein
MHHFLLKITTAINLYPPPDNINLADVQSGKLTFNWTSVISDCSTARLQLLYNITSTSDCGTCTVTAVTPTTVTATCSNLLLTTNVVTCLFKVSSHVCGLIGNPSSPIELTLKGELENDVEYLHAKLLQCFLFISS